MIKLENILKSIPNQEIIESERGQFIVQARERVYKAFKSTWTEWHDLNDFGSMKHALKKKHSFIVMVLMRELGVRTLFIEKRTNRRKEKGYI